MELFRQEIPTQGMMSDDEQPKPAPGGRPSGFTEERAAKIVEFIRGGNFLKVAALASGIDSSTLYRWLRAGKANDDEQMRQFYLAVEGARAQAEADKVALIKTKAEGEDGDWRAAAWMLERMYPDRWGRQGPMKLEHSGKHGAPIAVAEAPPVQVIIALPDNGRSAPNSEDPDAA